MAAAYAGLGREERQGAVAPVVAAPARHEGRLVADGVDGQQLDARHAQPQQVLDGGVGREPGVRAPQALGDAGHAAGQPAHVRLVDDGVGQRDPWRGVPLPVERPARHDAVRDHADRVPPVPLPRVAGEAFVDGVREGLGPQVQRPVERAGVRVQQELRRVVPVAEHRFPPPGGAVAVPGAHGDVRNEAVPHAVRA